jgi:hypothetical protein
MTTNEGQNCGNCRFASDDLTVAGDEYTMFMCQRFPPSRYDLEKGDWFRPLVADVDWCGEWQPRPQPSA